MERLAICSKLFYDRDVIEKHKKILELEKQVENLKNELKEPKSFFYSRDQWDFFKQVMYDDIKETVERCILDDGEYDHMEWVGLTPAQEMRIGGCIEKHLIKLTEQRMWPDRIAHDVIMYSLKAMFESLHSANQWMYMYHTMSRPELADMIYKHIAWLLDDETHSPCILEKIPIFECKQCHEETDFVNEKDICVVCEYENGI